MKKTALIFIFICINIFANAKNYCFTDELEETKLLTKKI
jgi:hypothetical protein